MLQISKDLVAELVADAEFPEMHEAVCESLISAIKDAL
jgi:hypothetical protein